MKHNAQPFYLAIIPARGGSKRIPRKNLALLAGQPLLAYAIEAARHSRCLTRTIVSTDDQAIADAARSLGAEVPFLRPKEMAQDDSSVIGVMLHALENIEGDGASVDAVVLLQPTSPLRTHEHIDQAIALFSTSGADTVVSVCHSREHPYWSWTLAGEELQPFFSMSHMSRARHELPPAFVENGAIFIVKKSILNSGTIYGKKIMPYLMNETCSVDIDMPDDLLRAQFLLDHTTE